MALDRLLQWGVPRKPAAVVVGGVDNISGQESAIRIVNKAMKGFTKNAPLSGRGFVIAGGQGSGCTTVAALVMKRYAQKGLRSAKFTDMTALLSIITQNKLRVLALPYVLVIDNFHLNAAIKGFSNTIMTILQSRADQGKPTVIVTHYPRGSMKTWAEGRFSSWAAGVGPYAAITTSDLHARANK